MAVDQKASEFTGCRGRKFDILRLICYTIILVSFFLAIQFDRSVHANEIARYHGEAPGDFLTFRSYAVLATHPRAILHISVPFLYPPPFLLFTAALSWLSPAVGFIVWIGGGNLCLALAARLVNIPWKAIGLGLIMAPNLFCTVMGQSGILVSCFLLAAFGLAETQPVLSGLAAGLVIIKPQFGLLIPVCYLSTRNWRAAVAAVASAASLACSRRYFLVRESGTRSKRAISQVLALCSPRQGCLSARRSVTPEADADFLRTWQRPAASIPPEGAPLRWHLRTYE